jgi:hypothetical protein
LQLPHWQPGAKATAAEVRVSKGHSRHADLQSGQQQASSGKGGKFKVKALDALCLVTAIIHCDAHPLAGLPFLDCSATHDPVSNI